MRWWLKPEVAVSAVLFLAALLLMIRRPETKPDAVEARTESAAVARHPSKSDRRHATRSARDTMPPLSSFPTATIQSIYWDLGFVVLRTEGENATVSVGEIAHVAGVARQDAWLRVTGAGTGSDRSLLVADLEGVDPGLVKRGDRVEFSRRPVRGVARPTLDPAEISWTDPDSGEWID